MDRKTVLIKANSMILPRLAGEGYISGVGRSTQELVSAILQEKTDFDIALYATGLNSYWLKDIDLSCPKHRFILPQKIGTRLTHIEPSYVHSFIKKDLIHIPHNYDVVSKKDKMVVTIHDTCLYDLAKAKQDWQMATLWEKTAQQAAGIITCSQNTKEDIIDRFGINEKKIQVVPWGVSHSLFHQTEHAENLLKIKRLGIYQPFFLSVSCNKERKNIATLLRAFSVFSSSHKDVCLILLWKNPPRNILEENLSLILEGRIRFIDYVTDGELCALYNEAIATLFPSRYEGFGFPILESFACGTPVMTCPNSSLKEIGSNLALYTSEDDIEQMAGIMSEMLSGKYKTKEKTDAYIKYAQKFTWQNTAKGYISFYKHFL